ncbi:MAG: aminotransferase class I/II-fold pyridoxal phosphate-dependent enzyme, partial [Clostridiales bacterium]|nr:aminotransferase class I/II-fold pyridoxal phosphate-dependent enzyme [Clostridiales bacterium]
MNYLKLDKERLKEALAVEKKKYDGYKAKNFKLDISRGNPCVEQLNLSNPMLDILTDKSSLTTESGADLRNYSLLDGIPEIKRLYADILNVEERQIIAGGSSSLNMMYDAVQRGLQFGFGGQKPWNKLEKVRFICPSPGYDRHFSLTKALGIEMITVKINIDGPDMDEVERLASNDESVKGIWCVPRFSNPTGITYSDETVKRLARMSAAPDFRVFWDNAYAIHVLKDGAKELLDILPECEKAGNPDRAFIFASTSKVTFSGAGVGFFASSEANIKEAKAVISMQ